MTDAFNAKSTAAEVLSGVRLTNKTFLVTGVSSGIGLEVARALGSRGANVVGTLRNLSTAEEAIRPIRDGVRNGGGSLELVELDLASLASVRACADNLWANKRRFNGVVANAGILGVPNGRTADGFELHFGTNYLGHFALLQRVAALILDGGRLVTTSSQAHRSADVDLDDPNFEQRDYDPWIAYARSKTANALLAKEFDRRSQTRGICAVSVEPGITSTRLDRQFTAGDKQALFDKVARDRAEAGLQPAVMKTAEQGASTPVWALTLAPKDAIGGHYLENCSVAPVNDSLNPFADGVRSYAVDAERAKQLWARAEVMVKAP